MTRGLRAVVGAADSIVRGTTSKEIIMMAREAGAKKVYFASCAPAIRCVPNDGAGGGPGRGVGQGGWRASGWVAHSPERSLALPSAGSRTCTGSTCRHVRSWSLTTATRTKSPRRLARTPSSTWYDQHEDGARRLGLKSQGRARSVTRGPCATVLTARIRLPPSSAYRPDRASANASANVSAN